MKKLLFALVVLSLALVSCGNNGNKAETKDAQEIKKSDSEGSLLFGKVQQGSYIEWRASHLAGANKRFGKVMIKDAKVEVNNGKVQHARIIVDLPSLTVESFPEGSDDKAQLTEHLKSADFFDAAKYPTAMFELSKIESASGQYNAKVTGNLTIKDQTKSISFAANVKVADNSVMVQSEPFSVDRSDWGLTYHMEGAKGVPVDYLIANDMGFTIHLSVAK